MIFQDPVHESTKVLFCILNVKQYPQKDILQIL